MPYQNAQMLPKIEDLEYLGSKMEVGVQHLQMAIKRTIDTEKQITALKEKVA